MSSFRISQSRMGMEGKGEEGEVGRGGVVVVKARGVQETLR